MSGEGYSNRYSRLGKLSFSSVTLMYICTYIGTSVSLVQNIQNRLLFAFSGHKIIRDSVLLISLFVSLAIQLQLPIVSR